MKIHKITPKDYIDLHRLYCQLEDDWTSNIHDMIRVLEEVKDDPHYHLVGIAFSTFALPQVTEVSRLSLS